MGQPPGSTTSIPQPGSSSASNPTTTAPRRLLPCPVARYRLSFRAKVVGEQVLRAEVNSARLDICSATSTYHAVNGRNDTCNIKRDGWNDYSVTFVNSGNAPTSRRICAVSTSAATRRLPYNSVQTGRIRIHSIVLQRDESGSGGWGPNLLTRSDPDTFEYVDQIGAARLDEIFRVSEQYGVYHKLTLFHKNDDVLNRFLPDGTVTANWDDLDRPFYSQPGQAARWYENAYMRYFVARWSYTPALHSLELANENHLTQESYAAGFAMTDLVHGLSPRHILMSNSFWGWLVDPYFNDPTHKTAIDYSDKHWYANETGSGTAGVSGRRDQRAVQRLCGLCAGVLESIQGVRKLVRAQRADRARRRRCGAQRHGTPASRHRQETRRAPTTTRNSGPMWASWATRATGSGIRGCLSRIRARSFRTAPMTCRKMFAAYERFLQGEPLSNGRYREIGTDLSTGTGQVLLANTTGSLRAWGRLDPVAGKGMLWIDNAYHTWWNVVQGCAIPAAGARLTIQGLPAGTYSAEWWDTTAGSASRTETYTVGADGRLTFTVSGLAGDVAVKFTNTGLSGLAQASIPLHQGWNLVALPLVLADPSPSAIFAPIAGRYSAVFAYNACDSVDPWKKFDPNAPSFVNDLYDDRHRARAMDRGHSRHDRDHHRHRAGKCEHPALHGREPDRLPKPRHPVPLPDALASIAGKYARVHAYEPTDSADPWKAFDPSAPSSATT